MSPLHKRQSQCEPRCLLRSRVSPILAFSVQSMSKQMDRVYAPERLRWSNISEVARDLGWAELAAQTAAEFLDTQGVSKRFSREIVEAATRCNYGQVRQESMSPFAFSKSCHNNPGPGLHTCCGRCSLYGGFRTLECKGWKSTNF